MFLINFLKGVHLAECYHFKFWMSFPQSANKLGKEIDPYPRLDIFQHEFRYLIMLKYILIIELI